MTTVIDGIRLEQTCQVCPEQYDAYLDETGEHVGYLRLSHGYFSVHFRSSHGELLYDAHPGGDGIFLDDERSEYLAVAVRAIRKALGFFTATNLYTSDELRQELQVLGRDVPITARIGKHGQTLRIAELIRENDGSVVIVLRGMT